MVTILDLAAFVIPVGHLEGLINGMICQVDFRFR